VTIDRYIPVKVISSEAESKRSKTMWRYWSEVYELETNTLAGLGYELETNGVWHDTFTEEVGRPYRRKCLYTGNRYLFL
jgi:hypothetical protein